MDRFLAGFGHPPAYPDQFFSYGKYEVFQCHYVPGTGETCALELARLLNEAKKEQE